MINVVERILNYKGKLLIIQNSSTTLLFKLMTISDIPNDNPKSISTIADTSTIGSIYQDSTTGASYITTAGGKHSIISTITSPTFITSTVSYGGSSESKKQPDNTGAIETLFKLIDDLQTSVCTLQSHISTLECKLYETEKKIQSAHEIPLATPSYDGLMSKSDRAKLDTIEYGATLNSNDGYLLSRSNHIGIQTISSISGLQAALDSKAFAGEK